MKIWIARFRAIQRFTLKRLIAQRGLAIATFVGLTISVALIMSAPLYSDAVYFSLLGDQLADEERFQPPFSYMFTYIGSWHGPLQWEDLEAANDFFLNTAASQLDLPQTSVVRHFRTPVMSVFAANETQYDANDALDLMQFSSTDNIENHITLIEGAFPAASANLSEPIEVLITEQQATDYKMAVGDSYLVFNSNALPSDLTNTFQVVISGIWRATEPEEDFWFYRTDAFNDHLLIPQETYQQAISPSVGEEIYLAVWYLLMDGSRVQVEDVEPLINQSQLLEIKAQNILPNVSLQVSPIEALNNYVRQARVLTISLLAFSVPVFGLIIAFIGMVAGLSVDTRRTEIAVLRSRGGTAAQVIWITLLEGLLIGVLAWVIGALGGLALTQFMGKVRSFMDFSNPSNLRILLTTSGIQVGIVAVSLSIFAQLLPTISAARNTIVSHQQSAARNLTKPWWQRLGGDFLLALVAAYGIYVLRQQGGLFTMGAASQPFQNPLLLLVPSLAVFATTLFVIRLIPIIMGFVSWIVQRTNNVGLLLAVQHLARTPHFYATPLILLVLTVSLAVFTASLARTMDLQLFDQVYYQTGADVYFYDQGSYDPLAASYGFGDENYFFNPVNEYEKLDGVETAARVGSYRVNANVGGSTTQGVFIGVDRVDFQEAAFWREDFATLKLGYLMNNLALAQDGVLVSRDFASARGLHEGDTINLGVNFINGLTEIGVKVAGTFDYFPTWYPEEDGPAFIGNLNYLFEQAGTEAFYNVWITTNQAFDLAQFQEQLSKQEATVSFGHDAGSRIAIERTQPERQGLFGFLSVSFLASSGLTVIGFFLYAYFSFQRRYIELGVLRSMGMSAKEMITFLVSELGGLIITGLAMGTLFGIWISLEFIPHLQFGATEAALVPPYLVEIAWDTLGQIYLLFIILFSLGLGALAYILQRSNMFKAVKLGLSL